MLTCHDHMLKKLDYFNMWMNKCTVTAILYDFTLI